MTERLNEIGKRTPEQLIDDAVDLYSDLLIDVKDITRTSLNDIVAELKSEVKTKRKFKNYTVSDYKEIIYKVVDNVLKPMKTTVAIYNVLEKCENKAAPTRKAPTQSQYGAKECIECGKLKSPKGFQKTKGGSLSKICKECKGRRVAQAAEKRRLKAARAKKVEKDLEDWQKRNRELEKEVSELKLFQQNVKSDGQDWYFCSAITKDRITSEFGHVVGQVYADSAEHAIGKFITEKELSNQIIISLSHEKSIFNQDTESDRS